MAEAIFAALDRLPAYKAVEQRIRRAVLDGSIAAGAVLPTEGELADQFGVTRSTVREAIRSLENSGLLHRGARRRLQVAAPDSAMLHAAFSQAIMLHGMTFREIWEAHMAIEPMTAELAARHAKAEVMQRLEQNLTATEAALGSPAALVAADIEFHALIAEASTSRALMVAREPLGRFLFPAYSVVVEKIGPGQRLLKAHRQIAAAIRQHDRLTARGWMERHILDFRRGYLLAGGGEDDVLTAAWTASSDAALGRVSA